MNKIKPIALLILDGQGFAPEGKGNAVTLSDTSNLDHWREKYPTILINASGEEVGLPAGQMGNSEVGHLNIGAGRIVRQSLSLINNEIKENKLKDNVTLQRAISHAKKAGTKVNLFALTSDGGVHSSLEHIIELSKIIKKENVEVVLHAFLDGRDTAPKSAKKYLKVVIENNIKIGSISGRYYSMDRDKRWERTDWAYQSLTNPSFKNKFTDPLKYVDSEYEEGRWDEFIYPASNGLENLSVEENDVILFANFRPDRARQLTHMFIGSKKEETSYEFHPKNKLKKIFFVSLMKYPGLKTEVMFPPVIMNNLIGEVISNNGLNQIRAAETEKYPHVTFFMDGGRELKLKGEKRILIHSPKVPTYDLQPEMSCKELTDEIIKQLDNVEALIINFAQPDMVGHTGVIPAVIKAVETGDKMAKRLYDEIVIKRGGIMMITADHGNSEEMLDKEDNIVTKHTTNPVYLNITSNDIEFKKEYINTTKGKLSDLAPTMLTLLGLEVPKEMTGHILIDKK